MSSIEPRSAARREADRRAIIFVLVFGVLALGGFALLLSDAVDKGFTQPFTRGLVGVCKGAINLFGGKVTSNGPVLSFIGASGAVEVANGCNAVEVSILLAAAIIAYPRPPLMRAIGVLAGVAAVQGINLLRIITLLYISRWAPAVFDFFHLYVWDAFIVLDAVLIFFVWARWRVGPREAAA